MSDLYIPLDYDQVPEEIQQQAGNLFTKITCFYPGLRAEVDENGFRFSLKIDNDILTQQLDEMGILPEPSTTPGNKNTPLEKSIIDGIQEAIAENTPLEAPPVHPAREELLALYADALNSKDYTTTSVFYEIGRINQKNSDNLKRKIYNLLH